MFVAIKDGKAIFGRNLEKLLKQADEGSDYREIDNNEIEPCFCVINGKLLNVKDEKDNEYFKAYEELGRLHHELRELDIRYGARSVREFLLTNYRQKFTEEEMRDKEYLAKIYEGESKAVELREELKKEQNVIARLLEK